MERGHYLCTLGNEARQNNKWQTVCGKCEGTESPPKMNVDLNIFCCIKGAVLFQGTKTHSCFTTLQFISCLMLQKIDKTFHTVCLFFCNPAWRKEIARKLTVFFFSQRPKSNVTSYSHFVCWTLVRSKCFYNGKNSVDSISVLRSGQLHLLKSKFSLFF